jgi:hypothetical protein
VTPATVGMKRHTSGASSISLKQQKKQDLIKKKRKLAATKRWENIHNLAALHQHRTKIALDTERIARGGGQYVEDPPSSSTSPPSVPNEWPFSHITHDIGAQIELSKQLTTFYPHSSDPIPDRNPSTFPSPAKPKSSLPPRPPLPPPTSSATLAPISSPRAHDSVHRQPRSAFCAPFHTNRKAENSRDSTITRMPSSDPARWLPTCWTLRPLVRSTSNTRNPGNNRKETVYTITPCCMRLAWPCSGRMTWRRKSSKEKMQMQRMTSLNS